MMLVAAAELPQPSSGQKSPPGIIPSTTTVTTTDSSSVITSSNPSQPRPSPMGPILGAIFASLAFLGLASSTIFFIRRRRRKGKATPKEAHSEWAVEPFTTVFPSIPKRQKRKSDEGDHDLNRAPAHRRSTTGSETEGTSDLSDPPPTYRTLVHK
ncbi:hypothetical protein PM082_018466 [Marasmius tenuissimus]|nr:hypothetical protein PM082_018466 [Marasmius tenuissimus]